MIRKDRAETSIFSINQSSSFLSFPLIRKGTALEAERFVSFAPIITEVLNNSTENLKVL